MIRIFAIIIFLNMTSAYAIRESRPTAVDSRIRVIVYSPDDVFKQYELNQGL
jgi:type IV secretion system protein VirB9